MIDSTAKISEQTNIAASCQISPFVVIEGAVTIGENCKIGPNAYLKGPLTIGDHNQIGAGAVIGGDPQDRNFDPKVTGGTRIGNNNIIREHATIHRNTQPNQFTSVGDDNFLMAGAHLAHDVTLGNGNTLANNVLVGGHVHIGDSCFLGGGAVFHQFIRIGDYAITQGNSGFGMDIPPFCLGHSVNKISGLNIIGLKRAGFTPDQRKQIKQAYQRIFHSSKPLRQQLSEALAEPDWLPPARQFLEFFLSPSKRGIICRETR